MEELYLPKIQPPETSHGQSQAPSSVLNRAGNMYSQLETMMSAVRNEALALDAMKQKLSEMEDLKTLVPELKSQLAETEGKKSELERALRDSDKLYQQLRNDMQRLNDLYNTERRQHLEAQNANMQLETEMSRVQQEVSFLQREADKMAEMRKKVQTMQQQLNQSEESIEELKKAAQRNILAMKKKMDDAEMEKSAHLAILSRTSDDLDNARADIKRLQDEKLNLQVSMNGTVEQAYQEVEAIRRRLDESMIREERQQSEAASLQSELRKLKEALASKTETVESLQLRVKSFDDARQQDRNEAKLKLVELTDTISMLKAQNHMLERQSSDAVHKLGLVGGDIARFQAECDRLRTESEQKDAMWAQKENLVAQHMQALANSKDEAIARNAAATAQIESLQNQLRDLQANHWENLQRTKESDAQIAEETDALQQELHEKSLQLIAMEAEKSKLEEYVNAEVLNASQLSSTLRAELEKRIEELTQMRKERDALQSEKVALLEKVNECDNVIKRNDALFKKTLETDRQKIQQEVRSKLTRLKTLEVDKQELLNETNELMAQLTDAKKECSAAQQSLVEMKRRHEELSLEFDAAQNTRAVLDKKILDAGKKEHDLKEALMQIETKYRLECEKFESQLKESKKDTVHQLMDMSGQIKYLSGELESLQGRNKDLDASEKKAWAEADRLRTDMESIVRNHDKSQVQMAEEFAVLKRENRELKMKVGLMTESKGKTDIEIMNLQVEMTKSESEIGKLSDMLKEAEYRLSAAEEKASKSKSELDVVQEQYGRCKLRNVELEESMTKKTKLIEKQAKDLSKLEREGVTEVKRLRLLLTNAEREVVELKPMVSSLQKEVSDGRSNFIKLQNTTNSTVNGLLEELRSTEDALALERKRCTTEVESYHSKITELQNSLDRAREHLEEHASKTKADRTDKDMRMMQLERENERLRDAMSSRDGRITELEKQKQSDRLKLHEMRDKLDSAERDFVDAKANIELEQTQRKMLESRVRQLEEQLRITREQQFASGGRDGGSIFGTDERSSSPANGDQADDGSDEDGESSKKKSAVMSPIDRVSAALASRAAAESNKSALKQAQQLRMQRANSSSASAVAALVAPIPNPALTSSRSMPNVPSHKSDADRLSYDVEESGSDGEDHDDEDNDGEDDVVPAASQYSQRSVPTSSQSSPQQEQLLSQKRTTALAANSAKPSSVEDSISKTQSFLQRRLAAQARMANVQQLSQSQSVESSIEADALPSRSIEKAPALTDDGDQGGQQSYLQAAISASKLAAAAFDKQMSRGVVPAQSNVSNSPSTKKQADEEELDNNDEDDEQDWNGDQEPSLAAPSLNPYAPNFEGLDGSEDQNAYSSSRTGPAKKKKSKKSKKLALANDTSSDDPDSLRNSYEVGFLPKINPNSGGSSKASIKAPRK